MKHNQRTHFEALKHNQRTHFEALKHNQRTHFEALKHNQRTRFEALAFWVHKIWPFWHFFPFFDPDSSRKILSKNQTYASIPAFFPQKMTRIGQFFPFYPILMAPLNQAILALFYFFFALIRYLKFIFCYFLASLGWAILANRPKI